MLQTIKRWCLILLMRLTGRGRPVQNGDTMARNSTPHDDKGREQWPVVVALSCMDCGRVKIIRTISLDQLRRTARRAGWQWIDWPVNCKAKLMTCRRCMAKPHNERADNGPTTGT